MALTADQQAMLQLILERDQSYQDLATILGVGVDEVRSRARGALTELAGADPDAEVGLTDYLLGQADPIGRADAVRQLQSDPEAHRLASDLIDSLRGVAPQARLPELPTPRERRGVLGRRREPAAAASRPPPAPSRPSAGERMRDALSRRQQRMIIGLGASAVLVIAAVLAIAGAFGGNGSDSATEIQTTTTADENQTTIALEPQGGGQGSGEATFGVATQDQAFVELNLSDLEAPPEGQTYVVWLLLTEDQGYPLSPLQLSADGTYSDRLPIPRFAVPIAIRARFVDISVSENRSLLQDLRRAVNRQRPILGYQGESVLRGEIPATAQRGGGGQDRGG